jgi:hypothetical protein
LHCIRRNIVKEINLSAGLVIAVLKAIVLIRSLEICSELVPGFVVNEGELFYIFYLIKRVCLILDLKQLSYITGVNTDCLCMIVLFCHPYL